MAATSQDLMIIDRFLEPPLLEALLAHALAHEQAFSASTVAASGEQMVNPESRVSQICQAGLGSCEAPFLQALHARLDELCEGLGLRRFEVARWEVELVAHGDGAAFVRHIDTFTQKNRDVRTSDRILTTVFYFHREPRALSGGEIAVLPIGADAPRLIEPCNNRLVAFPSFTAHEVLPVCCPGGEFADSRFAVNCWLHRARRGAAAPGQ